MHTWNRIILSASWNMLCFLVQIVASICCFVVFMCLYFLFLLLLPSFSIFIFVSKVFRVKQCENIFRRQKCPKLNCQICIKWIDDWAVGDESTDMLIDLNCFDCKNKNRQYMVYFWTFAFVVVVVILVVCALLSRLWWSFLFLPLSRSPFVN